MRRVRSHARGKARPEAGYALLMAVFMVATLILLAAMATPSVLLQGRRARDREDIWRANQYVRAIRLYYQKNGKYPQTLEDITKADVSGAHYLRKVYKNLNNPEDGSWRMIYVSPSGQLIGSVRYHTLQEMAAMQGQGIQIGGAPAAAGAAQTGQTPGQTGAPTSGLSGSLQPASLTPLEPVTGPVLGGFLIGVGGKMKRNAVVVYQGGKRYYDWEFIWNPLTSPMGTAGAAQAGGAPGAGAAGGITPANPLGLLGLSPPPANANAPAAPTAAPSAPPNPGQQLPVQLPAPVQPPQTDPNQPQ